MSSFFGDENGSASEEDTEEEEHSGNDDYEDEESLDSASDAGVDFLEAAEEEEDDGVDEPGGLAAIIQSTQNRAEFLSATEIRHLTAAFEVCDKAGTGEIAFEPFMKCLAVMGKKVTRSEARDFFDKMDVDKSGFISIDEWIGFYANNMQFAVDEKELLDSFIGLWQQPTAQFPETCQRHEEEEYIPKDKLFEIMTKYGEKLTDEEAAEMVRECRPDESGRIFFENYRTMLIDTTTH